MLKNSPMVKKIIFTLAVLIMIQGCGSSDEPSKRDQIKTLLIAGGASWLTEEVTIDGTDNSGDFDGFSLKFKEGTYEAVNGGVVWPVSGTWNFVSDEAKSFVREDGVEVEIEELTETTLSIALNWTKTTLDTGGKISSRKGKHKFKFKRAR